MKNIAIRLSALLPILAILLFAACTSPQAEEVSTANSLQVIHSEQVSSGPERYVATLAIEGMGCEMMCGTKIAGVLNGLDGVITTDIDFKGEGEVSNVVVEFNAESVNEQQMIEAVSAIASGHYKVKTVEVVHFMPDANTKGSEEVEVEKGISLKSSLGYRLPNIFSIFRFLF
jgi:copper chaperone CopZ